MADDNLSAVNVNDIPVIEEIKSGDYVVVESTDGTGIIDYKDFIIGTDNITFASSISSNNTNNQTVSADLIALSAKFTTLLSLVAANSGLSGLSSTQLSGGWSVPS